MGTLAMVLAGKKIRTFENLYQATVTGDIEDVDGILKITRIHVHYSLQVPEDKREDARNALEKYLSLCPSAQSVIGCIDILDEAVIEELEE